MAWLRQMDGMVDWLDGSALVESWNGMVAGGWRWNGGVAAAPRHVCAYLFRVYL